MRKKYILIGAISATLIGIVITTFLVKQIQDNRQRAQEETPTESPTATPTPAGPQLDQEEWNFLQIINNHREGLGLEPLKVSKKLTESSEWMSNDMKTTGNLDHVDSMGRNIDTRIPSFGYTSQPISENIAAVFASAQSAFDGWLNACDDFGNGCTYAHKVNMEDPRWRAIGIARAQASTTRWYWTTDFGTVLDEEITPTPTPSTTEAPTPTNTVTPTTTENPTQAPEASSTPTSTPTNSPTPTSTPTSIPSKTPTPTRTPTPTPTNSPTPTVTPTPTHVPTEAPTPTAQPTETPTPLPIAQATNTPTPLPPITTYTPTPTLAPTGSAFQTIGIISGVILFIIGGALLLLL